MSRAVIGAATSRDFRFDKPHFGFLGAPPVVVEASDDVAVDAMVNRPGEMQCVAPVGGVGDVVVDVYQKDIPAPERRVLDPPPQIHPPLGFHVNGIARRPRLGRRRQQQKDL
jgi:hypothetical protein